jgi:crotonobetainyl-CoA:carnitine CoA-transferase CaiB-like acyl-CoA transferase
MTYLVQLLLPLADSRGEPFPESLFAGVTKELTDRFGGLTAYARAPAAGLWKERPGKVTRDDIVVYEVMVEALDAAWWSVYRGRLEQRFAQDELVIRAQEVRRL